MNSAVTTTLIKVEDKLGNFVYGVVIQEANGDSRHFRLNTLEQYNQASKTKVMKKITQQAVNAFLNGKEFRRGNTEVTVHEATDTTSYMYLHGNNIAYRDPTGLYITVSGEFTNVKKERLNGLPGVHIHQKDGDWYLNGEKWNGDWNKVG